MESPYSIPGDGHTIFDTGTSHLFLPLSLFDVYLSRLIAEAGSPQFFVKDGEVFAECVDTFPSLYFMYDFAWIQVLPDDYLIDVSPRGDRSICHLLILANDADYFLLGLPLFQGYYAHHDMESAAIGLIPHTTSAKHLVKRASVYPSTMLEYLPPNIKTRYIVMLAMFAAAIVYYLFIYPLMTDAPKTLALFAQFAYVAACIALFYLFVMPVLANPTFRKPDHPWVDQVLGFGIVCVVLMVLFCAQKEAPN